MISTMAQLKNCCLGGLKAGTEREGKNKDLISEFNPLFPLFLIFDQLSLSRDIINPIVFDQINYLPGFHTCLLCATINDSLRARIMC